MSTRDCKWDYYPGLFASESVSDYDRFRKFITGDWVQSPKEKEKEMKVVGIDAEVKFDALECQDCGASMYIFIRDSGTESEILGCPLCCSDDVEVRVTDVGKCDFKDKVLTAEEIKDRLIAIIESDLDADLEEKAIDLVEKLYAKVE